MIILNKIEPNNTFFCVLHSEVHHWPTSSTLDGVANFNTSSPWSESEA